MSVGSRLGLFVDCVCLVRPSLYKIKFKFETPVALNKRKEDSLQKGLIEKVENTVILVVLSIFAVSLAMILLIE